MIEWLLTWSFVHVLVAVLLLFVLFFGAMVVITRPAGAAPLLPWLTRKLVIRLLLGATAIVVLGAIVVFWPFDSMWDSGPEPTSTSEQSARNESTDTTGKISILGVLGGLLHSLVVSWAGAAISVFILGYMLSRMWWNRPAPHGAPHPATHAPTDHAVPAAGGHDDHHGKSWLERLTSGAILLGALYIASVYALPVFFPSERAHIPAIDTLVKCSPFEAYRQTCAVGHEWSYLPTGGKRAGLTTCLSPALAKKVYEIEYQDTSGDWHAWLSEEASGRTPILGYRARTWKRTDGWGSITYHLSASGVCQ